MIRWLLAGALVVAGCGRKRDDQPAPQVNVDPSAVAAPSAPNAGGGGLLLVDDRGLTLDGQPVTDVAAALKTMPRRASRAKVSDAKVAYRELALGAAPRAEALWKAVDAIRAEGSEVVIVGFAPGADRGRELCRLTRPAPPANAPVLSILIQPNNVWLGLSRVDDLAQSSTDPQQVAIGLRRISNGELYQDRTDAELAIEYGTAPAVWLPLFALVCKQFPALDLRAAEALTAGPKL